MPNSSAELLLEGILRDGFKKPLACILQKAQRLEGDMRSTTIDRMEVYRKASLCMFGDVKTSLELVTEDISESDSESDEKCPPDSRLILRVTDRWQEALPEFIGSRSKGSGETQDGKFLIDCVDEDCLPANAAYELKDEPPMIALCPLATAIHWCVHEPDNYVILGPALASSSSVALATSSKKYDDFKGLVEEIADRKNKAFIGLLEKNLTTSYMVKFLTSHYLKLHLGDEKEAQSIHNELFDYHYFFNEGYDFLNNPDHTRKADAFLVLFEDINVVKKDKKITIIERDIETKTARIAGMDFIPRGVFLGRKSLVSSTEGYSRLKSFFDDYHEPLNRKIAAKGEVREAWEMLWVESDGNRVFFSFDQAHPEILRKIKTFADEIMFPSPFGGLEWDSFLTQPTVDCAKLMSIIKDIKEYKSFSHMFLQDDVPNGFDEKFSDNINSLISRLEIRIKEITDEFRLLFECEVLSKINEFIKQDNHFLHGKPKIKEATRKAILEFLKDQLINT